MRGKYKKKLNKKRYQRTLVVYNNEKRRKDGNLRSILM